MKNLHSGKEDISRMTTGTANHMTIEQPVSRLFLGSVENEGRANLGGIRIKE